MSTTGLLAGRTVLVTGVLRPSSIATAVAAACGAQGARVVLTGQPRTIALTLAVARRLGLADPVLELDVAETESLAALPQRLAELGITGLDGAVHAIAHADTGLLGTVLAGPVPTSPTAAPGPERAAALARALTISAASLPALLETLRPMLGPGSAVVALTFDTDRVHPGYGWMGPMKAALEATVRACAVELGGADVRVNAVSAGPLLTPAGSAVPGIEEMAVRWDAAAPLGWDARDAGAVADAVVALLSPLLRLTTGQVLRADGGAGLPGL